MIFFFYLMIEVRKMEVLPFALLLIEANATIKHIKCMRLHIFTLSFSKSLEVLYLKGINNHRRKLM